MKTTEKMKDVVIDFKNIEVKDLGGHTIKLDMSKNLGNFLYQTTGDLGVFEFAQQVYKEGKVAVPPEIKEELKVILKSQQCPFVLLVKLKLIELLS